MPRDPREIAYEKHVRAALKKWRSAEDELLGEVSSILRSYRAEVVAQFVPVTDWQSHYLGEVERSVRETMAAAANRLSGTWRSAAVRATAIAFSSVDDPLTAIGLPVVTTPAPNIQQLAILNQIVPELIVDVTDDVTKQVRSLMRQAQMGGLSKTDLVTRIGNVVGPLRPGRQRPPGTVFSKANVRARTILRTEMNRLHNLAKMQRAGQLSERYPGVGVKWIHNPSPQPRPRHERLHGTVIYPAKGEKFHIGEYLVDGPHDLSLPAEDTINCHCTLVVVYLPPASSELFGFVPADPVPAAGLRVPAKKRG